MDTGHIWIYITCCVLWQNIHGHNLGRRRTGYRYLYRCKNTCSGCFNDDDSQFQISCGERNFHPLKCDSVQKDSDGIPSKYKCPKKKEQQIISSDDDEVGDDRLKKRSTDCKHACEVCFIDDSTVKISCDKHAFTTICQCENGYQPLPEHMCPESTSFKNDPQTTTESTKKRSDQNGRSTALPEASTEGSPVESGLNTENNYTALYVMMVLIIVVFGALITIFIWRRHKSQINTTRDDNNALVLESCSTVPTSGPEMSNDAEYSEIPVDAIYSDKTGNIPNVSAVNAYDHLKNQANFPRDVYSHLITSRKLDHTDNTYHHIANTSGSQQKQNPSDESADAYNKIQKMPTNEPGRKADAIKNLDPDYNHLKFNQKPNVNKKSNDTDDYSHIGQSQEQKGKGADTNVSTVHVHKEACVDEKDQQSKGDFNDDDVYVDTTPVFTLQHDNKDDDKTETERHYFVLEKHDKETDGVSDGVTDNDREYFILKKQDETIP